MSDVSSALLFQDRKSLIHQKSSFDHTFAILLPLTNSINPTWPVTGLDICSAVYACSRYLDEQSLSPPILVAFIAEG